jgi:alpha-beta hydrolase superfamily lysophospholipase
MMTLRSAAAGFALAFGVAACSGSPMAPPAASQRSAAAAPGVQTDPPGPELASELPFSFEREGRSLDGVVSVPAHAQGQRLAAVVLVHGSGPMSRDGEMPGQLGLGFGFDFPVYAELAHELSKLGYVVARYDKRTCVDAGVCRGAGPGGFGIFDAVGDGSSVVDDFVEDAKAAFQTLTRYEFVDHERTIFVGHSQGAQLVPRLLSDLPEVPAGVMLTPPYGAVSDLLREQGKLLVRVMRQAGRVERIGEGYELMRAADQLASLEAGRPTPARILGQPLAMWRSWIRASQAAPELARSLERPLLLLGGDYDYNVSPRQLEAWQKWLEGSPHRVALLPCVTHALNCISQSDPLRIEARDIGHQIDENLVRNLAAFLGETVGRGRQ